MTLPLFGKLGYCVAPMAEWFLFLPQVRLDIPAIVERAHVAEASGFDGIAFIDHLEAPAAPHQSIWEAMTIATWVAARTQRLRIGHLVLCDAFRHPAVLAKQAVTLSEASDGRFELGMGWGSYPQEFTRFGIEGGDDATARVARLDRSLALLKRYWGDGELAQLPAPTHVIPLVLGGTGRKTMDLVRRYADWWNVPSHQLDRLDTLRSSTGSARVSVQQMVGFIGSGANRQEVVDVSTRRFGYLGDGLVCGDASELREHFTGLTGRGVERFYVWFADFARPATIAEFAQTVIDKS
jgi:alkanesulfonate monooxygenase SsuD/methylene tetrahydromethanopterin reductase-like flavin-dependent oxidoreductase (luciferase family)